MDVAGEQQLDVEHNLFKQRLDKDLKAVTLEAEKHGKLWLYSTFDPLALIGKWLKRLWLKKKKYRKGYIDVVGFLQVPVSGGNMIQDMFEWHMHEAKTLRSIL